MKAKRISTTIAAALLCVAGCSSEADLSGDAGAAESWEPIRIIDHDGPNLRLAFDRVSGWHARLAFASGQEASFFRDGSYIVRQAQSQSGSQGSGTGIGDALSGGGDEGAVFSGSIGGSSSFSGGSDSAGGFSGSSDASGSFSGGSSASNGFSAGLATGVPLSCDPTFLCDFIGSLCEGDSECNAGVVECRSQITSIRVPAAYEPIFCAIIEFVACMFDGQTFGATEEQLSARAEQCIQPLLAVGIEEFRF